MERTGALQYTRDKALEAAEQARQSLSELPDSDYKQALLTLTHLAVDRVA
jgi:octaprenyl-diphosphate synthase